MPAPLRTLTAMTALLLLPAGCDDEERGEAGGRDGAETIERPARPPPGWRTVRNPVAGFAIAAPKTWPAETSRKTTFLRSKDRLVSITLAADRSAAGRELSPTDYARQTMRSLPGFEGKLLRRVGRVRGSPYRSAVVEASGTVNATSRPQRISVATFRDERTATYTAVVFRNARVKPRVNDRTIARILGSFRAQAPRP